MFIHYSRCLTRLAPRRARCFPSLNSAPATGKRTLTHHLPVQYSNYGYSRPGKRDLESGGSVSGRYSSQKKVDAKSIRVMDNNAHPPYQAPNFEEPAATLDEPSPQPLSSKKRPVPEADGDGDGAGSQKAGAHDPDLPSPKRLKVVGSPSEVEMSDTAPLESGALTTDLSAVQGPSKAHGGWNRVISSGLRTSFAGKDKLRKPPSQRASESPAQAATDSVDVGSLAMPSGDVNFSRSGRGNVWQRRFTKWCVRLMAMNKEQERLKDLDFLREAWGLWLETHVSLTRAHRAAAMQAAKETNLDSSKLQEMLTEALETSLHGPWDVSSTEAEQSASPLSEQQSNGGQSESSKSALQGIQEGNDWILPPSQSSTEFDVRQKDQRAWEEKFVVWCRSLAHLNEGKIKAETARERNRVSESYLRWVGTIDGLSKAKAAAARRSAVHYAQDNSALLTAVFAGGPPHSGHRATESDPAPQEDSTPSPRTAVSNGSVDGATGLLDGEDAEHREKYFPGIGPNETFCHLCASRGHDATKCPEMICRFCHDPEHRSFSCPTRKRCTKCRQLGHAKKDCNEKLALPQDEMECAFCESRDHVDASCHELWRSFLFDSDTARKVRSLPVFCYCCGRQGHFGPDCGLNPEKMKESQWGPWSQANCDRYLDPASSEVAIVEAGSGSAPSSERPDLGKSIVPNRHIFFEEADDDDEADEFIRPPVQRNARVEHISFSGNGGGSRGGRRPSKQHGDRNGGSGYTQPPLPPGPPPPLPPHGRNGGFSRRRGGGARY